MREDFQFLSELFGQFFGQKSIKGTLVAISEYQLSGWEKWIQIEFAKFCRDHADVAEWNREYRYLLDRRITKAKYACAVDFVLRQKHKHSAMAIEFKQKESPGGCIKEMINDISKIRCIRNSENDLRSVWCLGVHGVADRSKIEGHVLKFARASGLEISLDLLHTTRIGKTDYSFTLF